MKLQPFSSGVKKKIVAEIRADVQCWRDQFKPDMDLAQACFHHAIIGAAHFNQRGIKAGVVGGSLWWPRINMVDDDGKVMTHFSYVFDMADPMTALALADNKMPEMHAWIVLSVRKEIVDLTTRYLKEQCKRCQGGEWIGADPPDFLWVHQDKMPKHIHYKPDARATGIVAQFARNTWG